MRVEGRAGHGRRRTRVIGTMAAAAVAAGLTVPWVGAEASRPGGTTAITATTSPASCCSSPPTACARTRVEEFADDGDTPGFRELLRKGTYASDNGLLTQAPPNTGAGWFTLATGAWPGVHGSTNNTFHINGALSATGGTQTFSPSRTAAFDNGVLQAETLAQSAERAGKRVAQIEWAGGRGGAINGPTLDFRNFRSGRGVATNYIAPEDSPTFTRVVRAPVRPPGRVRRQQPVPRRRRRRPATGWTNVPTSLQPGQGDAAARAGRPDAEHERRQVRPQRVHLRQPQRPQDALRPRAVQHDQERQRLRRQPRRGRVGRRQGHAQTTRPTR